MAPTHFTIFVGDGLWQLGELGSAGPAAKLLPMAGQDPAGAAATVRAALDERGYCGQGVVLALPTAWCLSASISAVELPRRSRHVAMQFRLEAKLPVAAEDLVCDFVETAGRALGVAVLLQAVKPWVDALETAGIAVQHVCPVALLAAQALCARTPGSAIVLHEHGTALDWIHCEESVPVRWLSWPAMPQRLNAARMLSHMRLCCGLTQDLPIILAAAENDSLGTFLVEELSSQQIHVHSESGRDAAIRTSAELTSGRGRPWINLRRDNLQSPDPIGRVRRPLQAATLGLVLLLLSFGAGCLWRAAVYTRLGERAQIDQRSVFLATLPGQEMPASIRLRMQSEHRRLQTIRGQTSALPTQSSALESLSQILRRLPGNLRFRLMELRFTGDKWYLEGQARSHSEAEAIAAALRTSEQIEVEPIRTEQLTKGGVAFSLAGSFRVRVTSGAGHLAPWTTTPSVGPTDW